MEYFEKLLALLDIERQEDRQSYIKLIESSSAPGRRAAGLSWYPIAIRGSELGRGDYLTVELERTTHQEIVHQLRFGMPAALFSNHDPAQNRVEGVISHLSGNSLKLTLRTDELPEWSRDGKLGIDLLFDDNSYDEMTSALKLAMNLAGKGKKDRLVRILTGEESPQFDTSFIGITSRSLNASQQEAVNKIVSAQDLAIVHGPPGTGKTTTLVQAIVALAHRDKKPILVVAPSNAAVDLLSEKLADEGLNVLRVGNPVRVSERLMSLTLDAKMAAHSQMKEIRRLKKQANEFRTLAHKYKRNFGRAEREQRKALFDEAHRIIKEVGNTEQYIVDDLVSKAQVIAATLVGANHYTIRNLSFHTAVIDEAGQALEPACWIPVLKAEKIIMAGDHYQLPPTIKSAAAAQGGLGTTLLEKCVALHPSSVVLLNEQYRMNKEIMAYSSSVFYGNKLSAHPSVADRVLFSEDAPLEFIDTAGCGFSEKREGTSISNPEEAAFLLKHLARLALQLEAHYSSIDYPTIGVVSPYKEQVNFLKEHWQHSATLKLHADKISVNTIDSFQGQERDIIFISMTRSNEEGQVGFLSDIRRMNVAMTRAKKKLVIIGDSGTLSQFPFYDEFISYAEKNGAYKSAWEFINA
ncbi:MAG TPA: AAA domain-containing protein [Chitinophagaceae bacterium]|nr:AAA domain-containing protein [Chitinophagaceae bacterium]